MTTRYWLTITGMSLVALTLWFYNNPAQADVVYQTNDLDKGITLTCTADTPSEVVAQCRQALVTVCPNGGTLSNPSESAPGESPVWLTLTVVCKESGVI